MLWQKMLRLRQPANRKPKRQARGKYLEKIPLRKICGRAIQDSTKARGRDSSAVLWKTILESRF
jgi:hypothetical protein